MELAVEIGKLDKASVRDYYIEQVNQKSELLMLIYSEITAVQQLVETYIYLHIYIYICKYNKIVTNAKDIDIYLLDRACADADRGVG